MQNVKNSYFTNKIALRYLRADKLRTAVISTAFYIIFTGLLLLHAGGIFPHKGKSVLFDIIGFLLLGGVAAFSLFSKRMINRQGKTKTLFITVLLLFLSFAFLIFGKYILPFSDKMLVSVLGKNPSYYMGIALETFGFFVFFFGILLLVFNVYSTISVFGVFLGTSTMIVVLSVLGGMEGEQTRQILKFSPHIIITRKDHKEIGKHKEVLKKIRKTLNDMHRKFVSAPYLEEELLLKSVAYDATQGVLLRGIDPDSPTFNIEYYLQSGTLENLKYPDHVKWLDSSKIFSITGNPDSLVSFLPELPGNLPGIILSGEQAKTLGVSLGSAVDVISPEGTLSPTGMIPKVIRFRVAGIYVTKYYKYDLRFAFASIPMVQVFSGRKNIITGWEIRIKDESEIDNTAKKLAAVMGEEYSVNTWKTRNKALFNAMKLEKFVMFIILIVIILVAAFSITANLIMVVMDKRPEIAILKAMGAPDSSIMKIFMMQGVFIGITGLVSGLLTGLSICLFLSEVGLRMSENIFTFARIPVLVNYFDIFTVIISTFMISLIATIYPARKATVISPVEGLTIDE